MTKKTSVFLLSLCLLISLSKQHANFDYIQVVFDWQPAMCNIGKSCQEVPDNKFSIHGVWPSVYSKGRIGPCEGPRFDPSQITSLEHRMSQHWPDLQGGTPMLAWSIKWSFEGTCMATVFNQFQFFCMGLDTYARHSMLSFLQHGGLFPNSTTPISQRSFIKAIVDATSKKGGVICAKDYRGQTQVQKAVLCYAMDGATLIDCPNNVNYSCPEYFMWLALGD